MDKYSVFHIEGGVGKNVLATAVVSSLKKSDPERKIIITTAWPAVWFNNPNVDQVFVLGQTANFYKNFIKDKDVKIYRQEPYNHENYILNKEHLILTWCRVCGIEWDKTAPQLYFSPLELEFIKLKYFTNIQKPVMIIQSNGGGPGSPRPYSWYRDLPYQTVKDVVDYFKNDYFIYQLGFENQILAEGATRLSGDLREMLACFGFSRKRLLIDSFGQHCCAGFGLPSVVAWVGNSSDVLGYNLHKNVRPSVQPKFDTLHSSYMDDADIGGNPIQYPYDTLNIFDSTQIINELIKL